MPNTFEKAFEVRWSDVDINGHLRNTSYSEYANHARACFFQEGGLSVNRMIREGIGPVLLSEQIDYRKEALLGQSVIVSCQLTGMSADGKRWRILHTLLHADGTTAATLSSSGAWMDIKLRKLVGPPPELLSLLETVRSTECQLMLNSTSKAPAHPELSSVPGAHYGGKQNATITVSWRKSRFTPVNRARLLPRTASLGMARTFRDC